jgi:hypothetical protein
MTGSTTILIDTEFGGGELAIDKVIAIVINRYVARSIKAQGRDAWGALATGLIVLRTRGTIAGAVLGLRIVLVLVLAEERGDVA